MLKFIQPEGWKKAKGYSNGVLSNGETLEIAGQIGWDAQQIFTSSEFIGQMEQALRNVRDVLEAAGGSPEHLTRLTWYVTDKSEYLASQKQIGEVYRSILGHNFPAMTMVVVSALVEDEALVEIEATACLPVGSLEKLGAQ